MSVINQEFTIITILGDRFSMSMREILRWFTRWQFLGFLLIALTFLLFFTPHNQLYHLDFIERLYFWPSMIFCYIIVYLITMAVGVAIPAKHHAEPEFYTMVSMAAATTILSISSSALLVLLSDRQEVFPSYLFVELGLNMLLATLFESLYFSFIFPRVRSKTKRISHRWKTEL